MLKFISISAFLLVLFTNSVKGQGEECLGENEIPPSLNENDNFPFAEAGLQIFSNLRVPCSGVLTKWSFLPRYNYVLQLHLAVFRPTSPAGRVYQVVGDTYIDVRKIDSSRQPDEWIIFPVRNPIAVMENDILGMYYDNFTTVAPVLSIASKKLARPDRDTPRPTFILLLDSSSVSIGSVIDISNATREFRVPALAATVVPVSMNQILPVPSPEPFYPPIEVTTPMYIPPETRPPPTRPRRTTTTTTPAPIYVTEEPVYETTTYEAPYEPPPFRPVPAPIPIYVQPPPPPPPPPTTPAPTQQQRLDARCYSQPTSTLFCATRQIRAFFDYNAGVCREYFGCPSALNDDSNNFATSAECRRLCTAATEQVATDDVCKRSPTALEVCLQKSTRYFYNPLKQGCMTFFGCSLGGLPGNNFDTLEQCNRCKGQVVLTPLGQYQPNQQSAIVPSYIIPNDQAAASSLSGAGVPAGTFGGAFPPLQ